MSRVLEGKAAIITGAGRGLGKVFAIRFAEEGAKLLLPDISLERTENTAAEIRSMGAEAVAMQADISDETATHRIAQKAMDLYGRADILLNNAALIYGVLPKPWDSWSVDEWSRMFAVNVIGTWLCCKAIVPLMLRQSGGKIINIASDIPKLAPAHSLLTYACSKSAVYTLTQGMARALGRANINVNAISPGRTATEASMIGEDTEEAFKETIGIQALKRREEPADLAGAAVFLASRDADFITGQIIFVNGGATMI